MMAATHAAPAPAEDIRSDLASLRRLWSLAAPCRRDIVLGLTCRFAQSFSLGLAFAVIISVIAELASGRAMTLTWAWQITGAMGLALAGQLLFSYLASGYLYLASFAVAEHMRLSMIAHLRALPIGFHLSRGGGDTVTALTTDVQTIEAFLADGLPRIAQPFGLPLAVLLYLASCDAVLACVAAIPIALAIPIYLRTSRSMARVGIQRQDLQAEAASRMIEFVQGIGVIRAFNSVAKGREDFEAALRLFRDISNMMIRQLTAPVVAFAMAVMVGLPAMILAVGIRLNAGGVDTGTAIAALILLFSLYGPLVNLVSVMELTRIADASLTRMDRIMQATPLPQPPKSVEAIGFDVQFDDVVFGYAAGSPVVQHVSFHVPAGSVTAIVGPSGSGKSTLLNLLARFWDVEQGAVRIGGADVRVLDPDALHGLVTVVFQAPYLFSGTIFDNIAFGRKGAPPEDVEAAARAAQAHDFIMALPNGYGTRVEEAGANLSGGERQRISIARAILKDAPIVLLDEATASIDASNQRAIHAALHALAAGKTVIVVAHRLSTIRDADQIVVLDKGRVAERGGHAELLQANGLYAQLWRQWTRAATWRFNHKPATDTPHPT